MPHPNCSLEKLPRKVLILGSGGLRIGQAGEFDYSGSQAIKALKEEKIETILVNPNIATVQTDPSMADRVYLQPLQLEPVTKIIQRERPDAILLGVGGQTALNLGLELHDAGILERFQVQVLGTPIPSIRRTEDRELFKQALHEVEVKTAQSYAVHTVEEALKAAENLGYPIMMRSGFSLGGLGSGKVQGPKELRTRATEALNGTSQILIEEFLLGWKEVEYEIVRDQNNNCITVCNMENFDPMGIHTGESIVVAPSQTLTNEEYHNLREIALRTARHIGIVGECNIQYALNPKNGDYRVIEINARLSRSSALASKATGYPLAFVATKLALGFRLDQLSNAVTGKTSAFFEPALDYLVVKCPRWDIHKLKAADRSIGSEMKSVGEVMAIGRSFPEALQKAIRMLNQGASGIAFHDHEIPFPKQEIKQATDRRLYAIFESLKAGDTVEQIHRWSRIDKWFLYHIQDMVQMEQTLGQQRLSSPLLRQAKQMGFSDRCIGQLTHQDEEAVREQRLLWKILPVMKQIDTLAGEFDAETNYLYATYHGETSDVAPSPYHPVGVLGSGPYCIGSSVEFDWCAVNTVQGLRQMGETTLMINSNPETVSTDYDESDRLYFEELSLERVRDISDFEGVKGWIVSVGGQIANNLALPLQEKGYPVLGTPPQKIDQAENRKKFSQLLNKLHIDQPTWEEVSTLAKAKRFATQVGYPLLVRPSYVLSGAAMNVVDCDEELEQYLKEATVVSQDKPVVISSFISHAKELEIDGVADEGEVIIEAISEHIENAGVHSGDATVVLPPQRLYLETIRRTKKITREIARALKITGPFNIQFIAKDNAIKVIECNVRASRSFPFVSKVTHHNFITIATQVLMGRHRKSSYETLELDYVGVKTPQFSYQRLKGANPVPHVEMASTGEVACLGDSYQEAFMRSWLATEQKLLGNRILVTVGGDSKIKLLPALKRLEELGWDISATEGTHDYLSRRGVASTFLFKASDSLQPSVVDAIEEKRVDLIINIPNSKQGSHTTDGFRIRRLAIDHHIPLITNLSIAQLFLDCLIHIDLHSLDVKSWQEFTSTREREKREHTQTLANLGASC